MVHRIQNRNPGYSDFAGAQNAVQLNSIKSETIASTSGANALKLDSDELKNTETEMFNSMVDENMALNSMSVDESKITVRKHHLIWVIVMKLIRTTKFKNILMVLKILS